MSADLRKSAVTKSFGRAAAGYEDSAAPQRQAAALLADIARQRRVPGDARILEVGCGTGILTRHIRQGWPAAELVVSDIAPHMVGAAARGAMIGGHFIAMDGEAPPFEGPWFDLILSNLAFQWFADPEVAIARLAALLRPGGSLIFSTMGADSFAEWRAAHDTVGARPGTPAYPSLEGLRAMLARHEDAFAFDEHWPFAFGGAKGFLAHLRGIGANVPASGHRALDAGAMRRVMRAFDAGGGVATYHVLFGRVTRIGAA